MVCCTTLHLTGFPVDHECRDIMEDARGLLSHHTGFSNKMGQIDPMLCLDSDDGNQ